MPRLGSCLLAILLLPTFCQAVDVDDLKPGLIATCTDGTTTLHRLDPTIAVHLRPGESVHPRLKAEGDRIDWAGHLYVLRAGLHRFSADLLGEVDVTIAGKPVLQASANGEQAERKEGPETMLAAGLQPITVRFTRTRPAARLDLFWQSAQFRREPIPADRLGHVIAETPKPYLADAQADYGRFLVEERGCVKCHQADASDRMAATLQTRPAPLLDKIGSRAYPGWLDAWLAEPAKLRPGTSMPALFAADATGRAERFAVVAYLTSRGGPLQPPPPAVSGEILASINRGMKLFNSTGCIACHANKPAGVEDAAHDSLYGLLAASGAQSAYPLGALGSKTRPEPLASYLANPHAISPGGRMPSLNLNGGEAIDLARYLCQTKDEKLSPAMPAAPSAGDLAALWQRLGSPAPDVAADEQWRRAGRLLFTEKGCSSCHDLKENNQPLPVKAAKARLADLRTTADAGCLNARPTPGKAAVYTLAVRDRASIAAFLKTGLAGAGSKAPTYEARVALKRFNCLNCHQRDGEGGLTPDLVDTLRRNATAESAEDLTPPTLTGVGHKLLTPWFKQVLTGAGRSRPWMGLRMPQYGEPNVGSLAAGITHLEGAAIDDQIHTVPVNAVRIEAGRTLIGKSGFGCISCHDIAGIPNSGTRGPDLASTHQRVRYDWYRRWMEQPQLMAPGTKMPQVFPEGKSLLPSVLKGDAAEQADAMWAYLSLGNNLPLPAGLEPAGKNVLAIAVKDRPEVFRTFLPEAGARVIAVGYPKGVSAAFDSQQCRLAYAWTGNFLDVGPVWQNRGGNPARLLGPKFWFGTPGHPWALSAGETAPDLHNRGNDPAYGASQPSGVLFEGQRLVQFEGYRIDEAGLPRFRYALLRDSADRLTVEEKPEPVFSGVGVGLQRHFVVDQPARLNAWLLAAIGSNAPRGYHADGTAIDPRNPMSDIATENNRIVVTQPDGKLVALEVQGAPPRSVWQCREEQGKYHALLKLPAGDRPTTHRFTLTIWSLAREQADLLRELKPLK